MTRFISPPRQDLDELRQPLTDGEKLVLDVFDKYLDPAWEIYIQPHLNGLRPDFVLLNPRVGIAVFEVKDWNLDALKYEVLTEGHDIPHLIATKNGKQFSKQQDNPVEQVFRYKKEIIDLYCPRLDRKTGFATITCGVIFPCADDARVQKLFDASREHRNKAQYNKFFPISGQNSLISGDIQSIFPESVRKFASHMSEDLISDLRNWLIEPDAEKTQRTPVVLDKRQQEFANTRTATGYRRIKGAAGSGKSLVLAARAAELVGQGKNVLVVTFNITLLHYLMDLSVRFPQAKGNTRKSVTWLNFHSLCKRICLEHGYENEYKALFLSDNKEETMSKLLPDLASLILERNEDYFKYDAILVDEGQDFLPKWWDLLRKLSKPNGEMLLVADATQDIYDTASTWTDEAMKGAGFSGVWSKLERCYRLPYQLVEKATAFAIEFLPNKEINLPVGIEGDLFDACDLRWVQTSEACGAQVCANELLRLHTTNNHTLAISDTTFLCDKKSIGYEVVSKIGQKGIRSVNTYAQNDEESRRQKISFYMGDARVKATTLHSFKGWESRALVIYVGVRMDEQALSLLYTGMTRLKGHPDGSRLTVVSCATALSDYGRAWPSYEEIYHA